MYKYGLTTQNLEKIWDFTVYVEHFYGILYVLVNCFSFKNPNFDFYCVFVEAEETRLRAPQ